MKTEVLLLKFLILHEVRGTRFKSTNTPLLNNFNFIEELKKPDFSNPVFFDDFLIYALKVVYNISLVKNLETNTMKLSNN
ncbi:hypothetical protein CCAN12_620045 [Capnocytophaga canimorsus]|uniref:Uncharacterized protein n=1 Tax=Capnocytophaga canimorsus TaxID=28188 RepID=A0A0B7HB17_9FLAO|nr:hypothetical protein CCAN12_620045 [Capnocytophaga canimorsus]